MQNFEEANLGREREARHVARHDRAGRADVTGNGTLTRRDLVAGGIALAGTMALRSTAGAAPNACDPRLKAVSAQYGSGSMDDLSIALPIYEGAEEQDVVGPLEMFFWMSLFEALPPDRRPIGEPDFAVDFITESEFLEYFYPKAAPKAKVFTVGPAIKTYRMSSGMQWIPDFSYDNAPAANMIVAPGGRGAHDIPARHKDGTIDYIKRIGQASDTKYVMSVCTGAFLLGAAGLLDGRHCQVSSHNYGRFEQEVPKAKLLKDPSLSFVQDGNLFTSNGPCSGLATSLRVVEVHCGTGHKNNLRELIEYIVPPVKGAVAENGRITIITV
jgi:putative intracellular protease/amidase